MAKLSERQRLWLTIGASVLLTGGITALVFVDRKEIEETNTSIEELEGRIQAADVEIKKTREREDRVIVFREVSNRELAILPQKQQVADFHANLTSFLTVAGARFTKLPDSAPKESELARGIYVTPNTIECEADAASLLTLINTIESDQRLVAIKGYKVKSGGRTKDVDHQPMHKVQLNLETYFYNPPTGAKPVQIASYDARLEDPKVRQEIAAFQPERPDSYRLRPSQSRRDPFVDVRKEVVIEDPEALRRRYELEEKIALDLEKRLDDVREKCELEKALIAQGKLFEADRISQEVDGLLNDLRVRVENVRSIKSVTFPDLLARDERVKAGGEDLAATRKSLPRELTITPSTATMTRDLLQAAFGKADYAEVNSISVAWEQFLRGKAVEPAAQPIMLEIKDFRRRAKVLAEFHQKPLKVTGLMRNPNEPKQSVALVNGKVVRVGETADDAGQVTVLAIERDGVLFGYMGEQINVRRLDGFAASKRKDGTPDSPPEPTRVGDPRR